MDIDYVIKIFNSIVVQFYVISPLKSHPPSNSYHYHDGFYWKFIILSNLSSIGCQIMKTRSNVEGKRSRRGLNQLRIVLIFDSGAFEKSWTFIFLFCSLSFLYIFLPLGNFWEHKSNNEICSPSFVAFTYKLMPSKFQAEK